MQHVVVIGAGQAGASLSKAYLLGDMTRERLFLRPESFYAEQDIELMLGAEVSRIDAGAKQVWVGDEVLSYSDLVLTTGLHDVDAMAPRFVQGARVLIVGGGYIGLEAAAVAAKLGLQVTLVEMSDRILQRVAAPETSDFFRALHGENGVDIREGVGLDHLQGTGAVTGAVLSDGSEIAVDFVIVGVGITPHTALAEAAGLTLDNGIKVDAQGRTSDPQIWAAGDCASFPYRDTRIRLESVPNAIEQAEVVAENLMGAGKPYVAKPWFWSDQYDVKLQIAGLNTGYDHVITRTGDKGAVSFWYYRGDDLLAVDAMNDPRGYMIGKRLIEGGKSPAPAVIADPATDMKALLKA